MKAAISFELSHCDDLQVYDRYTKLLNIVDSDLANFVARKVNGTIPVFIDPTPRDHVKTSPPLSQLYYAPKKPIIASRRIAILVADGFNIVEVKAVREMLASAKATTWIIGPQRAEIHASGGQHDSLIADHHFEGQRSTLFDALYIPSGTKHAKALNECGRAVHWVREAFGHCKAIGAIGEGSPFFVIWLQFIHSRWFSIFEGVNVVRHAIGLSEVKLNFEEKSDRVISSYGVVTAGKYDMKSATTEGFEISPGSDKGFVSNFAYEISKHRCYERETDGLASRVAY